MANLEFRHLLPGVAEKSKDGNEGGKVGCMDNWKYVDTSSSRIPGDGLKVDLVRYVAVQLGGIWSMESAEMCAM